jgi:hypothetical protein
MMGRRSWPDSPTISAGLPAFSRIVEVLGFGGGEGNDPDDQRRQQ